MYVCVSAGLATVQWVGDLYDSAEENYWALHFLMYDLV